MKAIFLVLRSDHHALRWWEDREIDRSELDFLSQQSRCAEFRLDRFRIRLLQNGSRPKGGLKGGPIFHKNGYRIDKNRINQK